MPRKRSTSPTLTRHKPSGQGRVRLSGQDHYLGAWPEGMADPPPEVKVAYHRLLSRWAENDYRPLSAEAKGAAAPADTGPTVAEVLARYWAHAEGYYCYEDGAPTNELNDLRYSLRPLNHLFGDLPARRVRPRHLKQARRLMMTGYEHPQYGEQAALCRNVINQRVGRIVRAFRWAVEEELVPPRIWLRLKAVKRLQKGRSKARETQPVKPVSAEAVEATLPRLLPTVAALVRFMRLTGARVGEACILRPCDLDRSGPAWVFRPAHHKTAHKGKSRVIAVGPKAQEVLWPWLPARCPLCGSEGRRKALGWRGTLCGW
jgi:integrase